LETLSLYRLHQYISRVIALNFDDSLYVTAEILQARKVRGHIYLELAEKGSDEDILAQASAVLWKTQLALITPKLSQDPIDILREGHEVRLKVNVDFHPRYGLKLIVQEIDEAYSEGKLLQKKQAIIQRLMQESLWQRNRQAAAPLVFQNIAIISSKTAAGYSDFMDQLYTNEPGYQFKTVLFPASMQGEMTGPEVTLAMENILMDRFSFDCIVLIRGGGAKADLHDFDHYGIAKAISLCPLPVLSGIGHQTDESIADLSAFLSFKTPTAVAEFLIYRMLEFESRLQDIHLKINQEAGRISQQETLMLQSSYQKIRMTALQSLAQHQHDLQRTQQNLRTSSTSLVHTAQEEIIQLESKIDQSDPEVILKRGFSITIQNNRLIRQMEDLDPMAEISTVLSDGVIKSKMVPSDSDRVSTK